MNSKLTLGGVEYGITTEGSAFGEAGTVTIVRRTDGTVAARYKSAIETPEGERLTGLELEERIHETHRRCVERFRKENVRITMNAGDYMAGIQTLMRRRDFRAARELAREATGKYPNNPVIQSYDGLLSIYLGEGVMSGIEKCKLAIERMRKAAPGAAEVAFPVLFLNLGRAYMAAGDRASAMETFEWAITQGGESSSIRSEMARLGVRRKPIIPFLHRTNPINKYFGMLLHGFASRGGV